MNEGNYLLPSFFMLFNSFQYWIFFLIVVTLFYSVPFRIGKLLLLGASYVFYMWWDPRFIVLILTSTVVDYFLGIFLERAAGYRKKLLLVVSLVVNLGILGFFKYYDFFAGSLAALLHVSESSLVLRIILPVGVSFYTFASLSYTFDFSGYTDIARGCAKLLGFEFPLNFARPLLSRNPRDFWRRWHMTLSAWVRDYLFIPLGGARKGPLVLYRNLMVVMVLVGLWHG